MGCRCGRRQGGLGLYVLAADTVEDMKSGAAWPTAGVSPRLWAALVKTVGNSAARTLLGNAGGDPRTRKKAQDPQGKESEGRSE